MSIVLTLTFTHFPSCGQTRSQTAARQSACLCHRASVWARSQTLARALRNPPEVHKCAARW